MEYTKPFDQLEDPHKKAQDAIDHAREIREIKVAGLGKKKGKPRFGRRPRAILYGPAVLHERRCIAARALQRSRNPNLYPITLSTPRSLNQPCDGEDSPRIYGDRKQSARPSWNCCRGL